MSGESRTSLQVQHSAPFNQSARSGVDAVTLPFPHSVQHMLQGSLLHAGRTKCKPCNLKNHEDNIWSCVQLNFKNHKGNTGSSMQLLEPEKWRNEKTEMDSPNLSICGRCLCNDRTGLWRWHGLLNHNAGVVVWHPCICQLVRSRSCHCSSNCVMHGDILWKEGKWEMVEENGKEINVLSWFSVL